MLCPPACAACGRLRVTALAIVGKDGIEALTLERLADEAHLPPEDVKAHYPTASACLYDTYEEVARSIYEDFAASFAAERAWRDALRLATRTLVRRMAARPHEARLCFAEILQGDYELLRRREASRQRLLRLFARELRRRCDYPEPVTMQLELLIGGGFQAVASAVAQNRLLTESETLVADLESRMFVFDLVAA